MQKKESLPTGLLRRLSVTQRAMECYARVSLRDRIRNEEIRRGTEVTNTARKITKLKRQTAGHIASTTDAKFWSGFRVRRWQALKKVARRPGESHGNPLNVTSTELVAAATLGGSLCRRISVTIIISVMMKANRQLKNNILVFLISNTKITTLLDYFSSHFREFK